jgi:hypothetical protein
VEFVWVCSHIYVDDLEERGVGFREKNKTAEWKKGYLISVPKNVELKVFEEVIVNNFLSISNLLVQSSHKTSHRKSIFFFFFCLWRRMRGQKKKKKLQIKVESYHRASQNNSFA